MSNIKRRCLSYGIIVAASVLLPATAALGPLPSAALQGWFGASPAAAQTKHTYDLAIKGEQVPENMRLIRVKQGDHVTLRWTADKAMQIHLHGYDIEKELKPNADPVVMDFDAKIAGRFPVEIHHGTDESAAPAGGEAPALLYLEVYP